MIRMLFPLLSALLIGTPAVAADIGESRCGADGMIEEYRCYGARCQWNKTYQRCANTNRAAVCNVGDTKCGADGYVQRCTQYAGDPSWQGSLQRCAADRDPADNAPSGYGGYGQRIYTPPSYGGSSGSGSEPQVCTPGQQECGDDRRIRRCVMQGGRAAWNTVPGSRCGESGLRK